MNHIIGTECIVPSALVFGEFPNMRAFRGPIVPRPSLAERAKIAQEARSLMSKHMAAVQIRRATQHQTPTATDTIFYPGQQVLVWKEKVFENRIGEWLVLYTVFSFDATAKIVLVQKDADSAYETCNTTLVKDLKEPVAAETNVIDKLYSTLREYRSDITFPVYLTEVIDKSDPRAHSTEMREAKRAEVQELLKRGIFKVILRSELPNGANLLSTRFVLAIKSNADGKIKY